MYFHVNLNFPKFNKKCICWWVNNIYNCLYSVFFIIRLCSFSSLYIYIYILWPEDGPAQGPKHVFSLIIKKTNYRRLCYDLLIFLPSVTYINTVGVIHIKFLDFFFAFTRFTFESPLYFMSLAERTLYTQINNFFPVDAGGISPRFLSLGTRWRWMAIFSSRPLYARWKGLLYASNET